VTHRETRIRKQYLHCAIKSFYNWLALDQKHVEFRAQYRQIKSEPERRIGLFLVWLKGYGPVFRVY